MFPRVVALGCACAVALGLWPASSAAQGDPDVTDWEELYTANLVPVNTEIGAPPIGFVTVRREGDHLEFKAQVGGNISGTHWMHIHGFAGTDPRPSYCATEEADTNNDGLVDIIEAREVSGQILIPFTDDPVSLNIRSGAYPRTDEFGQLTYLQSVQYNVLKSVLLKHFNTEPLIDRRVVYLHGVPPDTQLPDTVRSLEGVPAHVTLPVGCAKL